MSVGSRLRALITAVLVVTMFSAFAYGLVRFPDGPIHPCAAHGYCGKQGQPHTLHDFEAFRAWETAMLWLWPTGLVTLMLLRRAHKQF